jgi:hypothetical protein
VVHDRVRVRFSKSGEALVGVQAGPIHVFQARDLRRALPEFLNAFVQPEPVPVKGGHDGELLLIEHGHVSPAAPAIKPLHRATSQALSGAR